MSDTYHIGVSIGDDDWYWQQVYKGMQQHSSELPINLVSLDHSDFGLSTVPGEELIDWLEQQSIHELDALICLNVSTHVAWYRILDRDLPIISLTETDILHPLLSAPSGLDEIAREIGSVIATQLNGHGTVLVAGGLMDLGEAGRSRLAGLRLSLQSHPDIRLHHAPSLWGYREAYAQIYPALLRLDTAIDAIVGLNDPVALLARDAATTLDLLHEGTFVFGMGSYPEALAALNRRHMTATIDLFAVQFGQQVIDIAFRAVQRQPFPNRFPYQAHFVTALQQATSVQEKKEMRHFLHFPPVLPHAAKQNQHQLNSFELNRVINCLIGTIVKRSQLMHGIAHLIRANYGYDHVQILRWLADEEMLILEQQAAEVRIPLGEAHVLAQAIKYKVPIFIIDAQQSERFTPDPSWLETRTRIIIPIFLGDTLLGLLDIHSLDIREHTIKDLKDLEYIAERIGFSMHSVALYHEALESRSIAQHAQEQAEQANRLKTRLLANVSHEFRTPLNSILNYTQSMLFNSSTIVNNSSSTFQQDLQHIVGNTQHLARLINDLLDLSRAEIDELTLVPEAISTRAFLTEVFYTLAPDNENAVDVHWELALPDQLPVIEADPLRLRQVLLNLLDNARKFTDSGRIVFGAEVVPPSIHLWIQDTGCGIAHDQQERIFEPFVTGEQSKGRAQGVGLGLAITRRLIALHNGVLRLASEPGSGSTFHVYLPLSARNASAVHIPGMTNILTKPVDQLTFVQMIEAITSPTAAGSLLIVDDDSETRELYQQLAAQSFPDYTIYTAHDGATALMMLEEVVPSLVILDLTLPDIDGFALLTHLRSREQTRMVPVLVMSGRDLTREDVQRLDHAHVIFQNKDLLSPHEMTALLKHTLSDTKLVPQTSVLIKRFIAYLQHHYSSDLSLKEMADTIGVSERHLERIVQQELTMSPTEYLKRYRIKQARKLLRATNSSITAIAKQVGFDDSSYFGRVFRQYTGYSPRDYRSLQS